MPLTVAKALSDLPIFSAAQVVAGRGGIGKSIRWTHIVDNPELLPWVREGDLLLTTAFAIKDNSENGEQFITELVQKGLSGIVIAIGRYVQRIPDEMIRAADHFQFPLITLPWDVPFVEVTHAIHERLLIEEHQLTEQSLHIHTVLTQLVINGGGLVDLAKSLSDILKRSVTIEDPSLRMLAYGLIGPSDELRNKSIQEGRTPAEVVNHFKKIGIFSDIKRDPRPRLVQPAPELGMMLDRIVAPITVGTQLYGYIWIIATGEALTAVDFAAIERGAAVAALVMSREHAIYEAEQRGKMKILGSLIDSEYPRGIHDLTETMQRLGLRGDYRVLALEDIAETPGTLRQLTRLAEEQLAYTNCHGIVVEWGQRVVILMDAMETLTWQDFSNRMIQQGRLDGYELVIGVSSLTNKARDVRQSYQEAVDALRIGKSVKNVPNNTWAYENLGYLYWLLSLPAENKLTNRFSLIVEKIWNYDQERRTDFLKTLETFVDHLANSQETAESLFIHRNTLRQRLLKIQDLWDIDPEDPHVFINLCIAIKNWKLHSTN